MKYNEDLKKIVKEKNFKSFWHCLDYLNLAGYPILHSFSVALEEFGEEEIFTKVAFAKQMLIIRPQNLQEFRDPYRNREPQRPQYNHSGLTIQIGLIDETNIHLSGLYKVYRKWVNENKPNNEDEIQSTCETIRVEGLTSFLMEYLKTLSINKFGFDIFVISKNELGNRVVFDPIDGRFAQLVNGGTNNPEYIDRETRDQLNNVIGQLGRNPNNRY